MSEKVSAPSSLTPPSADLSLVRLLLLTVITKAFHSVYHMAKHVVTAFDALIFAHGTTVLHATLYVLLSAAANTSYTSKSAISIDCKLGAAVPCLNAEPFNEAEWKK